jgi:hypothetical protein
VAVKLGVGEGLARIEPLQPASTSNNIIERRTVFIIV